MPMPAIIEKPDTLQKLQILSQDGQYDLACACATAKDEHRKRSPDGSWIYPVSLPNGGSSVLFKTLVSNTCSNDCRYCPLRQENDLRRCTLSADETAAAFMNYLNAGQVFGLFLSSGVIGTPDRTMERLNAIASILRKKHRFRGYIHLKIIPGASPAAIEQAISLSSAVSLNIETPGEENLRKLSSKKDFLKDIVEPIKLISRLTAKGSRYHRVKQTTQFIVGAAEETDRQIVRYMTGLYDRLGLDRIYFSAYQPQSGQELIVELETTPHQRLMREHRLYQVDFLMRRYGFKDADIVFGDDGTLSLEKDPKETWAVAHPEFFPVLVNQAELWQLLRVPGLGVKTARRILEIRKSERISGIYQMMPAGKLAQKASQYLAF